MGFPFSLDGVSYSAPSVTVAATDADSKVKVSSGVVHFTNAQVIDMADAQVVLTLVQGSPTGTQITSNVLFVDANSGSTENLLLPPESGANGLVLFIMNTGGEDIVVKDDAGSVTIATVSTTECAIAACNGTSWLGGVVKLT